MGYPYHLNLTVGFVPNCLFQWKWQFYTMGRLGNKTTSTALPQTQWSRLCSCERLTLSVGSDPWNKSPPAMLVNLDGILEEIPGNWVSTCSYSLAQHSAGMLAQGREPYLKIFDFRSSDQLGRRVQVMETLC